MSSCLLRSASRERSYKINQILPEEDGIVRIRYDLEVFNASVNLQEISNESKRLQIWLASMD